MTIYTAYDELADLLARVEPAKVMRLQASEDLQERLEELLEKSKENTLTKAEKEELVHYQVFERLIRLAKLRAYKKMAA